MRLENLHFFNDKFEAARNTVLHAKSTQVELKYLDAASAKTKVYEDDADSYAIANARRRGDVTLSPSVTNAFFRQQILLGMEPLDIAIDRNIGTVGGPIDVSIISKGDGFIWLKRKHYFERKYNPQYFYSHFDKKEEVDINEE